MEEIFDEAYELLEKLCTENRITHEEYSLLWDCINEALDCQIHADCMEAKALAYEADLKELRDKINKGVKTPLSECIPENKVGG